MTKSGVGGKNITTFKARIKASKPHYLGKVIGHRETIEDGYYSRFRSYMNIFIPKLTHQNKKPCVMCHISNGAGSCLFRMEDPPALSNLLKKMADIADSDIWFDLFQELNHISEHLIDNGEILLDTQFVDIKDFKNAIGIKKNQISNEIEIKP